MAGVGRGMGRSGELAHRLTSGTGDMVTHYMHERPFMSGFAMFALGFLLGAMTVSTIGTNYGPRRSRTSYRFW